MAIYKMALNRYFTHAEHQMKDSIISTFKNLKSEDIKKCIAIFAFDNGIKPYKNLILAIMSLYKVTGIKYYSGLGYVTKLILQYIANYPDKSDGWINILTGASQNVLGKHTNVQGLIANEYKDYLNKFKGIRHPHQLPSYKKRKLPTVPGSKEDEEEQEQEELLEGKNVPVYLWSIPIALLLFTIFIGFKLAKKKVRGK